MNLSEHRPARARTRRVRTLLVLAVLLAAGAASAQYADLDRVDWAEDAPPPPPSYETSALIELEMPRGSAIRMGIDPATLRINPDHSVVRYVVVARGPSAVNASYEGIRCSTAEYRVYARQVQGDAWQPSSDDGWKPMLGQSGTLVRHPLQLARGGLCDGPAVRASVADMVRALRSGNEALYR